MTISQKHRREMAAVQYCRSKSLGYYYPDVEEKGKRAEDGAAPLGTKERDKD